MGKYTGHEAEFQDGFARGKWKTVGQFALAKGVNPNNGAFKKDTKGWKKRAQDHAKALDRISSGIAQSEIIKKKADVWESVYNSLANTGETLAKLLDSFSKEELEDTPFVYEDQDGNKRVDYKAIKGVADSAIQIHSLIKKTTTDSNIPLSAENRHKVEEASQIKNNEKAQEITDPLEGKTLEQAKEELEKLKNR